MIWITVYNTTLRTQSVPTPSLYYMVREEYRNLIIFTIKVFFVLFFCSQGHASALSYQKKADDLYVEEKFSTSNMTPKVSRSIMIVVHVNIKRESWSNRTRPFWSGRLYVIVATRIIIVTEGLKRGREYECTI